MCVATEWYASEEEITKFVTDEVERRLLFHSDEQSRKAWLEVLKARRARETAEKNWVKIRKERR